MIIYKKCLKVFLQITSNSFSEYIQVGKLFFLPTQRTKCGMQMRYNNLLCPLTTLYGNLWNQWMFYVSYMTLYDFQEIFSTSKENERYTAFRLWIFLYDPCMISRKSYMILVWLLGNHSNHICPCMNTRNPIWPSMTTKNSVWWATRVELLINSEKNRNQLYMGQSNQRLIV